MTQITASMVKELRETTGVGMMECKNALVESDGDVAQATKLLREKGAAKAVKRASRATSEGIIDARLTDDKRTGSLVEVNIETDFAARNERFIELVKIVADTAIANGSKSAEEVQASKPVGADTDTIATLVTDAITVIGENMAVGRANTLLVADGKSGLIHAYIHPPGKVGVLVALECENDAVAAHADTDTLAHDLCLQIAFSNPAGLDSSSIAQSLIDSEKEVYRNMAIKEGKPEKILDKIVEGRIKSFFKDSCLMEQGFVKEEKKSIKDLVAEVAKSVGGSITVTAYERFELGDNAEQSEA